MTNFKRKSRRRSRKKKGGEPFAKWDRIQLDPLNKTAPNRRYQYHSHHTPDKGFHTPYPGRDGISIDEDNFNKSFGFGKSKYGWRYTKGPNKNKVARGMPCEKSAAGSMCESNYKCSQESRWAKPGICIAKGTTGGKRKRKKSRKKRRKSRRKRKRTRRRRRRR